MNTIGHEPLEQIQERDRAPLHPAMGARILRELEVRLSSRARQRRRIRIGAAATLLPALSVSVVFWLANAPKTQITAQPTPEMSLISGQVSSGGSTAEAARLTFGRTLRTQDGAVLQISPDVRAELGSGAALSAFSPAKLEVQSGEVRFVVQKLGPKRSLEVVVDHAVVRVVGTTFRVRRDEGSVQVAVEEGNVLVAHPGGIARLASGQSWTSRAKLDLAKDRAVESRPAENPAIEDEPAVTAKPKGLRLKVETPAQGRGPESLLLTAARLVQAGEPQRALQIYGQLAETDPRSARVALYLSARIQAQKLGDSRAALETLQDLDRRFPGEALAAEVELARIEAWSLLGQCALAREASADFARRFPDSTELLDGLDPNAKSACRPE